MFVGLEDELGDKTDGRWAHREMGEAVVYYREIEAGHEGFLVGDNMSFLTTDTMDLLKKYNPLPEDQMLFLY